VKVFVTGASGFIGGRVVKKLLAGGAQVVGLVRSTDGESALRMAGAGAIRGDVRRPPRVDCDAVVHLASAPTEQQGSAEYEETDVEGARALVETYPKAQIIYASTIWVYGSSPSVQDEGAPIAPTCGLGTTKARVEKVLAGHTPRTIFRAGITYPGGAFERTFWDGVRRGYAIGGANRTGFISVEDLAAAIARAALEKVTGLYNLVDDRPLSWRAAGEVAAEAAGKKKPLFLPRLVVRLVRGKDLYNFASADLQISNARAKGAGFEIRHADLGSGLRALASPG
jgi:nucleoside-diphosphate-sugar epimerase